MTLTLGSVRSWLSVLLQLLLPTLLLMPFHLLLLPSWQRLVLVMPHPGRVVVVFTTTVSRPMVMVTHLQEQVRVQVQVQVHVQQ
jgi:hypothetical protein